jgi:hypothetical protein
MGGLPAKSGLRLSKWALMRPLEAPTDLHQPTCSRGQPEIRKTPPSRAILVRHGHIGAGKTVAMGPETIGCGIVALAVLAMAAVMLRQDRTLGRIADAMLANSTVFARALGEMQHAVTALERAAEAMQKLAARIHPPPGPAE